MKKSRAMLDNELNVLLNSDRLSEFDFIAYVETNQEVKEVVSRFDGKVEVTCTFAVVTFADGEEKIAAQLLHNKALERRENE